MTDKQRHRPQPAPHGSVSNWVLLAYAAGELVPADAVVALDAVDLRSVVVPAGSRLPAAVGAGAGQFRPGDEVFGCR